MARIYIDNDMAHFERIDLTLVDLHLYTGECFKRLEPRRLFPITGVTKYITLLDEEGDEVAVIRDLATLPKAESETITACLDEYYHIPKVLRITGSEEKFGVIKFFCETDRGNVTIEVRNIVHQIKLQYGMRVLFRDNDDNRYEIPDINNIDKLSKKLLDDYL